MTIEQAYRAVAKHMYRAYSMYSGNPKVIIILANNRDKAKEKAQEYFETSLIVVERVDATKDYQIYEV